MRILLASILGFVSLIPAIGAEDRFRPASVDQTVDPSLFPAAARIEEPDIDIHPPAPFYPWEMHSGIQGVVVLYIKIGELGYPTRIAVSHSSEQVFERSAVANALLTRWKVDSHSKISGGNWFIHTVKIVRHDS